ncbi:MAG: UbiA family prenyltransferase [Kiritimatiellae bacterium]|nr:UbiA family prenyltransferase [Kiritimatiellia bacterium]
MAADPKLRAWLQLVRPPNLLTVPGDPLAGACLLLAERQQGWPMAALPATAVALALYAAGLIINDCFDLEEDRQQRPDRPLPSGQVRPAHAAAAAACLVVLALVLAATINAATCAIAAILTGAILLYNGFLKGIPVAGPLMMGLCRGLSLHLGSAAVSGSLSLTGLRAAAALVLTLYVAAVTAVADREHTTVVLGPNRWLPLVAVLPLPAILLLGTRGWALLGLVPAAVAVGSVVHLGSVLRGRPAPKLVQASIGRYIRLLLLVQAALCFVEWPAGVVIALLLLLLWPASGRLGRLYYAS